MTKRALTAAVTVVALVAGCSRRVELHSELPEADANEVMAALYKRGVDAEKRQAKQGFAVSVPAAQLADAVSLLRDRGLPRQSYVGMGEVFRKDGMISTPVEERGRYLYALSQELERTISQIDGVLLARVHPVLPERVAPGEPVLPSSCAVLVKHRPGWSAGLHEELIRRLVSAGIPGLSMVDRGKVSVVFVEAGVTDAPEAGRVVAEAAEARGAKDPRWWMALSAGSLLALVVVSLHLPAPSAWLRRVLGREQRDA